MDVREKLVELQDESDICPEGITSCIGCKYHKEYAFGKQCDVRAAIADKMISHGVTVREWIPVEEKLPQNFISVLGYMTDAGEFPPVRECYTVGNAFFFPALGDVHTVSHWCEMPQPPKGE